MASTESPRRRIGRYEVEGELGRGMMGVVYRAHDPDLGRSVALKTVHLSFAVSEEEREAFERRFLSEARAAARLSHPGIVVVHDVGRDPEGAGLYIAFEHLRGRTLADLAADGTRLEWRKALRLTARVAQALQHAHDQGIVHRDIKPANIMLLESGDPKIMDFGIAKVPAEHLTATGQFWGTPSYMSPEQASGEPLDGRSDLFSLGAILYLLLTSRVVFEADGLPATLSRILFQDPPPPSRLVPGLPPALDAILARALAKKPAERYPDGTAFAEDLEDVFRGDAPRHCEGWSQCVSFESTQVSPRAPAPPEVSALPRERGAAEAVSVGKRFGSRRLGVVLLGACGAVALGTGLIIWAGARLVGLTVPAIAPPAHLQIDLEHSLRGGTLKVWVDDELVVEEPLESWVKEDLFVVKVRSGRERKTVDVRPGEHEVRVQVTGDGFSSSRFLRGQFEGGGTQRLRVRQGSLGGLLKKELTVGWAPPAGDASPADQ